MQRSHDGANVKECWCLGCTPHWPGGTEISCLDLVATDTQPSKVREGQALQALQRVAGEAQVRERGRQSLRQRLRPSGRTHAYKRSVATQYIGAVLGRRSVPRETPATSCVTHIQLCFLASVGGHHAVGKQPLLLHALDSAVRGLGIAKQPLVRALTAGTACSPARCRDRLRRAG